MRPNTADTETVTTRPQPERERPTNNYMTRFLDPLRAQNLAASHLSAITAESPVAYLRLRPREADEACDAALEDRGFYLLGKAPLPITRAVGA